MRLLLQGGRSTKDSEDGEVYSSWAFGAVSGCRRAFFVNGNHVKVKKGSFLFIPTRGFKLRANLKKQFQER